MAAENREVYLGLKNIKKRLASLFHNLPTDYISIIYTRISSQYSLNTPPR